MSVETAHAENAAAETVPVQNTSPEISALIPKAPSSYARTLRGTGPVLAPQLPDPAAGSSPTTLSDPRNRLVREKHFCLRPRPLERWLWSKRIPASAERVFWLHWQEGMQRGDWCSELSLSRVARECTLDVSTVTRAYQFLIKLGCLRRTDPGRDPSNPFQQATALTEIRLPRELLSEFTRHPNRRATAERSLASERSPNPKRSQPTERTTQTGRAGPQASNASEALDSTAPSEATEVDHRCQQLTTLEPLALQTNADPLVTPPASSDPFPGLTGRERIRAISQLTDPMSPAERHTYQEALRLHHSTMTFDTHSKLSPEARAQILQLLSSMTSPSKNLSPEATHTTPPVPRTPSPRKLSPFELARLHRELQSTAPPTTAPELMRQVVWSIETGSLRRFDTRHALHIALKKIREGLWTRPHRMPPNWARALSSPPVLSDPSASRPASAPDTCCRA